MEHPFNFSPVSSKFFLSHDSKYIVVFLINENEMDDFIDKIRILDINTLEIVKEIEANSFTELQSTSLVDVNLIWDSTFLYI
jgi:hypothetical protein